MEKQATNFKFLFTASIIALTAIATIAWMFYYKGFLNFAGGQSPILDGQSFVGLLALIIGGAAAIASAFAVVFLAEDANALQKKVFELEENREKDEVRHQKQSEIDQVTRSLQEFLSAADELDDLCKFSMLKDKNLEPNAAKDRAITQFEKLNAAIREIQLLPDELLPARGRTYGFYQNEVLKRDFSTDDSDIEEYRSMRLRLLFELQLSPRQDSARLKEDLLEWTFFATTFSCIARKALCLFVDEFRKEKLDFEGATSNTLNGIQVQLKYDNDHTKILRLGLQHLSGDQFTGDSLNFLKKLVNAATPGSLA